MPETTVIRNERPDQPGVVELLDRLDRYLGSLYAPQDNHILGPRELLQPSVRFFVARRGGAVVGCAAWRRRPGEPATGGQAYGEIKRMVVAAEARGQGIGAALLRRLEAQMGDERVGLALLETGSAQVEALRLYRRAGYAARAAFGGYPDNGLSLFLEKRMTA